MRIEGKKALEFPPGLVGGTVACPCLGEASVDDIAMSESRKLTKQYKNSSGVRTRVKFMDWLSSLGLTHLDFFLLASEANE